MDINHAEVCRQKAKLLCGVTGHYKPLNMDSIYENSNCLWHLSQQGARWRSVSALEILVCRFFLPFRFSSVKFLPRMSPHVLHNPLRCLAEGLLFLALTSRKHKRKPLCGIESSCDQTLASSLSLYCVHLCPWGLSLLVTGHQTHHTGCRSVFRPSPTHSALSSFPSHAWDGADGGLLLHLKAVRLTARCFKAVRLFEYQLYARTWQTHKGMRVSYWYDKWISRAVVFCGLH